MKQFVLPLFIFLLFFFAGCTEPEIIKLEKIDSLQLTDASSGYGARPEIVSDGENFYIIYSGGFTSTRAFIIKILDKNFNLIKEQIIATGSQEFGGPTDVRIIKDNGFLYVFYETAGKQAGAHLFGAKFVLNENFEKIADEKIADAVYGYDAETGEETLDDPASVFVGEKLYLMTKLKDPVHLGAKTRFYLRELNPNDLSVISNSERVLDLSNVMETKASPNSLLYKDNKIYHIQVSGRPTDLKMVVFDESWNYSPSDVIQLTTGSETETMPVGARFSDESLFVTYKLGEIEKIDPDEGKIVNVGEIWVEVFDEDFESIDKIQVSAEGIEAERATLEVVGDYVYVAYAGKRENEKRSNVFIDILKFR